MILRQPQLPRAALPRAHVALGPRLPSRIPHAIFSRTYKTTNSRAAVAVDHVSHSSLSNLPVSGLMATFDGTNPLVIPKIGERLPRQRVSTLGIAGDIEELFPYFNACIAVGKLDRAEMTLTRLQVVADGRLPHQLMELHDRYLRAIIKRLEQVPARVMADHLHKWYETRIRQDHLPQTVETIACMVKASLISARNKTELHRLVNRYMSMAPDDAGYAVLFQDEIISKQDLEIIKQICPQYQDITEEDVAVPVEEPDKTGQRGRQVSTAPSNDPEPWIRETPQKGIGLITLKKALHIFDCSASTFDISSLTIQEQEEIQSRLELDSVDAAMDRWRKDYEHLQKVGISTVTSNPSIRSRLYEWQTVLEAEIKSEISRADAAELTEEKTRDDQDRLTYGPYLKQSKPSRLAAIVLLSVLNTGCMGGVEKGVPISSIVPAVARAVEDDIKAQAFKDAEYEVKKARRRLAKAPDTATEQDRLLVEKDNQEKAAIAARYIKKPARKTSATTDDPDGCDNPPAREKTSSVHNTPGVDASILLTTPTLGGDDTKSLGERRIRYHWPDKVRAKIGACLIQALIKSIEIKVFAQDEHGFLVHEMQPAFQHAIQLRKGNKTGMLLFHSELARILSSEPPGDFLAKHLPMVVPPRPWRALDKGAWMRSNGVLVRFKNGDRDQRIYSEAAVQRGDMKHIMAGLDVLGKTAWRINRPIFDIMVEAWNSGEQIATIPPLIPDIPIPEEPESDDPVLHRKWLKAVKVAMGERSGLHSVRCFINFQLEIAKAFRNQTFYFPHNLDFRGRAYPMPTYLNHMGADHVRGLLRFAEGKPLGERGLMWLKVHLANVYGFDKASLRERESFAMENMPEIIDSATKPLRGNRWWLKAEDPWQCLATCMELKAAIESDNPKAFVSCLPVHQDGTCNGLQHYAALGGDEWGARQVNLEPGDRPADVYTAVADLVRAQVEKDAAAGNKFAMAVNGKISRKVVKQTVMTNVYGVTFSGARAQVRKQLDTLYPNLQKETGIANMSLAFYIATLIFAAMSNMFSGAHHIQTWLGEIGGRVCLALTPDQLRRINAGITTTSALIVNHDHNRKKPRVEAEDMPQEFQTTIVWTTPLRMPVTQPYRQSAIRSIDTCLQTIHFTVPDEMDPVNRRKQLQAFPPNFIHSLDASHMILSALECDKRGLTFAAVHDSFWTHPCDVDTMNTVLRDAFIRIHQDDVVGRLALEFKARYANSLYLARIDDSSQAAQAIKAWRRLNRGSSLRTELLLEYKRQTMLKSANKDEVAEAMQMETPATIYQNMDEMGILAREDDMGGTRLGDITEEGAEFDVSDDVEGATCDPANFDDDPTMSLDMVGETEANERNPTDYAAEMMALTAEAALEQTSRKQGEVGKSSFKRKVVQAQGDQEKQTPRLWLRVWLPLTFPPVPKKGTFDVKRLKESQYFFS